MRAMWKGSVSFGLVNIPVKMYVATSQHDVSFRQVRKSDGSRVRYRRVAEADGQEVAHADIAKGYELEDGSVVILTDEDFADLPLPTKKAIDVLEFVPLAQVDPIYFNKTYYLEPESAQGLKPYMLLRDALEGGDKVAMVKITISNREQLAALRVRDGVVVLSTMLWPDEIRRPDFGFLDEDVSVRPQEQAMADSLVESMSGDFDPDAYSDDYAAALKQVIDAKLEGGEVAAAAVGTVDDDNVVDLMAALRASVDRSKTQPTSSSTSPGEDAPGEAAPGEDGDDAASSTRPPSKRSTAKKTTAKNATAKKATDKKATAKKPAAKKAASKPAATTSAAKKTAKGSSTKKSSTKQTAAKKSSKKAAQGRRSA